MADVDGTGQAVPASGGSGQAAPGAADGTTVETTEAVRRQWPDVLHHLTTTSRRTWTRVAHDAAVLEVDAERLVLQFKKPGPLAAFSQGPHAENVRAALSAVLGMDRAVVAVSEAGGAARAAPPAVEGPASTSGAARPARAPDDGVVPGAPAAAPAVPAASSPASGAGADPDAVAGPPGGPGPVHGPFEGRGPAADAAATGQPAAGPARNGEAPGPAARADAGAGREKGYVPGWDDVPPPTDDDEPVPDDGAPPEARRSSVPRRPAAPGPAPSPRRLRVVPEASPAPAEDDEPSRDDADAEDSGLVGAALVAARLGGRVVEP